MKLDNLFNGDKTLGETMNAFLNERWDVLYGEVSPGFLKLLNKKLTQVIQAIMYTVPYNKLFLD